jgi:hypothetical protein
MLTFAVWILPLSHTLCYCIASCIFVQTLFSVSTLWILPISIHKGTIKWGKLMEYMPRNSFLGREIKGGGACRNIHRLLQIFTERTNREFTETNTLTIAQFHFSPNRQHDTSRSDQATVALWFFRSVESHIGEVLMLLTNPHTRQQWYDLSIEIDTQRNSRQRKLKLSWETTIGYESGKCTHAVQGGLLGGHKSSPVRH